jgi:hypothetical protein
MSDSPNDDGAAEVCREDVEGTGVVDVIIGIEGVGVQDWQLTFLILCEEMESIYSSMDIFNAFNELCSYRFYTVISHDVPFIISRLIYFGNSDSNYFMNVLHSY